ncbi:MAG: hypothetical protein JXB26_16330 [Candidatus Aminicenantes bacterium]|nr:hypothetical protein [Candidatus Aminicenantes bacterium]
MFLCLILFLCSCKVESPKESPEEKLKKLKSLPYLTWVNSGDTAGKSGVTYHNPEKACRGVNIYTSRNLVEARLMDMDGDFFHRWTAGPDHPSAWQHVELTRELDLLVVIKDEKLICLDWNSRMKWAIPMRFHHDLCQAEDGEILALVREDACFFVNRLPLPVLNSSIVFLSADGILKNKISLFPFFKSHISGRRIFDIYDWAALKKNQTEMQNRKKKDGYMFTNLDPVDILHINTVEIIPRDIPGVCRRGNVLICALRLDFVAILDVEAGLIMWEWGPGVLSQPHHPTMLENGNLLIFDNGVSRKHSRILEVDPENKQIVWEYRSNPPEKFFSVSRGASQRLPNGNTLITESDRGHVFEITMDGEVVWEFFNPEKQNEGKTRAAIYRMNRITDDNTIKRILARSVSRQSIKR